MGSAGDAESVLYNPHFALVLSGLGRAKLCRAVPSQTSRGERGLLRRVQTC